MIEIQEFSPKARGFLLKQADLLADYYLRGGVRPEMELVEEVENFLQAIESEYDNRTKKELLSQIDFYTAQIGTPIIYAECADCDSIKFIEENFLSVPNGGIPGVDFLTKDEDGNLIWSTFNSKSEAAQELISRDGTGRVKFMRGADGKFHWYYSEDSGKTYIQFGSDSKVGDVPKIINDDIVALETTFSSSKISQLLSGKVDKVAGKGLSTNDFTNEYKTAIDNLSTTIKVGAENADYTPSVPSWWKRTIDTIPIKIKDAFDFIQANFIDKVNEGLKTLSVKYDSTNLPNLTEDGHIVYKKWLEDRIVQVNERAIHPPVADIASLQALNTTDPALYPDQWIIYVESENATFGFDRDAISGGISPTTGPGQWFKSNGGGIAFPAGTQDQILIYNSVGGIEAKNNPALLKTGGNLTGPVSSSASLELNDVFKLGPLSTFYVNGTRSVNLAGAAIDNDVLSYEAATDSWKPKQVSSGTGSATSGERITKKFIIPGNTFTFGQVMQRQTHALAKADAEATAEVGGIVTATGDVIEVTMAGWIDVSSLALAPGDYFLSNTIAGGLINQTTADALPIGAFKVPVLTVDANGLGTVLHMRGNQVGEEGKGVVRSVKGNPVESVDNTDPENPVVTALPITGGTMQGNIKFTPVSTSGIGEGIVWEDGGIIRGKLIMFKSSIGPYFMDLNGTQNIRVISSGGFTTVQGKERASLISTNNTTTAQGKAVVLNEKFNDGTTIYDRTFTPPKVADGAYTLLISPVIDAGIPATATSAGVKGQRAYDSVNALMYECVAANTWIRYAITKVW